jgi:hypothetical protein
MVASAGCRRVWFFTGAKACSKRNQIHDRSSLTCFKRAGHYASDKQDVIQDGLVAGTRPSSALMPAKARRKKRRPDSLCSLSGPNRIRDPRRPFPCCRLQVCSLMSTSARMWLASRSVRLTPSEENVVLPSSTRMLKEVPYDLGEGWDGACFPGDGWSGTRYLWRRKDRIGVCKKRVSHERCWRLRFIPKHIPRTVRVL